MAPRTTEEIIAHPKKPCESMMDELKNFPFFEQKARADALKVPTRGRSLKK